MKSPAFSWYAKDFLSDGAVMVASNAAVGCYSKLLSSAWLEHGIPKDLKKIARLCGETVDDMAPLWEEIKNKWDPHPTDSDKLIQPRQERERELQAERREKRSASAKTAANARWGKTDPQDEPGECESHSGRNADAMRKNALASTVAPTVADTNKTTKKHDAEIKKFFESAKRDHLEHRGTALHIYEKPDGKRVAALLDEYSLETLQAAFLAFLLSEDPYLVKNKKPRNVAVFKGQIGIYIEAAARIQAEQKETERQERERERDRPPPGLAPDGGQLSAWADCLDSIREDLIPENFNTWFGPIDLVGLSDGVIYLDCPTGFYKKAISENYLPNLEGAIEKTFGEKLGVKLCCA